MSRIVINGKAFEVSKGASFSVVNGSLIVDGKAVSLDEFQNEPVIQITVEGNVQNIDTVNANVTVNGEVGSVKTTSGDIEVSCAVVEGSVSTMSGDIDITGSVNGNVSTMSGDVKIQGEVHGNATSRSGRVKQK